MNNARSNFKGTSGFVFERELIAAEKYLSKVNDEFMDKKKPTEEGREINVFQSFGPDPNSSDITGSQSRDQNIDPILQKYQKQLKSFGFPDIGNFTLSKTPEEKEKTLKFLDYVIMKKANENADSIKYKKQLDILSDKLNSLENENIRYEKEISRLTEEIKTYSKDKKDCENKLHKSKENYEKQINELKANNVTLQSKYNKLNVEKRSYEEKFQKMSEVYAKISNKSSLNIKPSNHIDMIESLRHNDFIRILSKVKGTEKLIETFKNGFNESLRELLFEITALKNFIYEINNELKCIAKNGVDMQYSLLNMPFLDTVTKIKLIFKQNISQIKLNKASSVSNMIDDFEEANSNTNVNVNVNDLHNTIGDKPIISSIFDELVEKESPNCHVINKQSESCSMELSMKVNNEDFLEEDYQKELEMLKNKWVKTLMSIKSSDHSN